MKKNVLAAYIRGMNKGNPLVVMAVVILSLMWAFFVIALMLSFIEWKPPTLGTIRAGILLVILTSIVSVLVVNEYGENS